MSEDEINAIKSLVENASANAADLKFPTDPWGFTTEVRKAVIQANSNVGFNKAKHDLLVNTLRVLIAHTTKRYKKNVENGPARLAYLAKVREATAEKQKQNYAA